MTIRQKYKNEIELGVLVSFVLLLIFTFAGETKCQQFVNKEAKEHKLQHTEQEEYEDAIRFKTITVLKQDSDFIYWAKNTKYKLQLSSFGFDKNTEFPKDYKQEGCYMAIYCEKHLMLYTLVTMKCNGGTK